MFRKAKRCNTCVVYSFLCHLIIFVQSFSHEKKSDVGDTPPVSMKLQVVTENVEIYVFLCQKLAVLNIFMQIMSMIGNMLLN